MNMNYLSLRYFLEIAHCLNFSQAAQQLHISQPGLSQQINALEKDLGLKLLIRSTRNVSLTEEGEYLYRNLLPSFENIDRIVMDLKNAGEIPSTVIRIATIPSAASSIVPELIKKLKAKDPTISFFMKETTSIHCLELVQRCEYHLAFIRTPIDITQSIRKPLRHMEFERHPLKAVVSGKHPAAARDGIDLRELKDELFLHYDPDHAHSLYYLLEQACLTAGFIPKTVGSGPEILTRANLVASGIGVTIMPGDMLNLLAAFDIKGLHIHNLSLYSSISAVWNTMNMPSVAKEALDLLKGT
ncbi:LysR family transcriptional regulator [Paenibacillus tarimensis]